MTPQPLEYKICKRCVMDTSDPDIKFNDKGFCSNCEDVIFASEHILKNKDGKGFSLLKQEIDKIKSIQAKEKYDCVIGVSGGVDSSYLCLFLKQFNLRVLAVHVDAGWNSNISVSNIKKIIEYCNYDFHTHVVNWNTMRRLQIAFLKSGIPNQDIPQDHVFFAYLYKLALKENIRYFISGGNYATESILPNSWGNDAMDDVFIKDVFKKHGSGELIGYELISFYDYRIKFELKKFKQLRPLNFITYNKENAIKELKKIGWKYYEYKHGESFFTNFFQSYILPNRYGYDKRKAHLSSLIMSNQITREQALRELSKPLYEKEQLENDINFFIGKLNISKAEFLSLLSLPKNSYKNYRNSDFKTKVFNKINYISKITPKRVLKKIVKIFKFKK